MLAAHTLSSTVRSILLSVGLVTSCWLGCSPQGQQQPVVAYVEVEYDYLVRQPASLRKLIANRSIAVHDEISYFSDRRAWLINRKVADFNRQVHRLEIIELHGRGGTVVQTVDKWQLMSRVPVPLEWYTRMREEYRIGKPFPTESEVRKKLSQWGTPRVVTFKGRRAFEVRDETRGRHRVVDATTGIVLEEHYRLSTGPWKPYQKLRRAYWVFTDGREYKIELP